MLGASRLDLKLVQEHVNSNAECLRRLMIIVQTALPHVAQDVQNIFDEWQRVADQINAEYEDDKKHPEKAIQRILETDN